MIFWIARAALVAGVVTLIVWGARRLDRHEAELELRDLADDRDDWTPPPFRRTRDIRVFVDQLDEIRALPEVAA